MSFTDTARQFALTQADLFENEARRIGCFRSVDATEAASWLREIAKNLRQACDPETAPEPEPTAPRGTLAAACSASLTWLENMAPTTRRKALSLQLRRALGLTTEWGAARAPQKETTTS